MLKRGYIYIWNKNPLLKNDHSSSIHTTPKILNPHLQKSLLPLFPNQQPLIGKSFDNKFDEFPNKNLSNSKFTTISKTTHFHPIFTPSNLPNHKIPNKNYPLTNSHYFYQKQLISHFKNLTFITSRNPLYFKQKSYQIHPTHPIFTEPTFLTLKNFIPTSTIEPYFIIALFYCLKIPINHFNREYKYVSQPAHI